jgi:glutamyl-tRNA reductase
MDDAGAPLQLILVGTSHKSAPLPVRERLAAHEHGHDLVDHVLATEPVAEAVGLATCNRCELYLVGADAEAMREAAVQRLVELSGHDRERLEPMLYVRDGTDAAEHLFAVAAGLDSLVPGEGEILGQVRTAYEAGTPGALLDRVFRHALHAGRKVRAQTAIGESPASVSSAAAALAEQVFGELDGRSVLLLGAGKVSEGAARNLRSRGATIALAADSKTDPSEIERQLASVDVVVSSTSSQVIVLDAATVARARRGRPLLLVDLAVPRDLDPAIHELDGCYLYDIDDLEAIVAETLSGRRSEAERAEAIVAAEAEKFHEWQASLEVVPAIASLRARAEEIREAELRKVEAVLGRLDESDRNAVESLTAQIVNKLLHLPTVRMKQAAAAADGVIYAEAVRHLFGLEDER